MEYRSLGNTGLNISRICFGTLTLGPLQANLSLEAGSRLIVEAVDRGINFFDTAELYDTYPYLRHATKQTTKDIIVASRSYAYTREMAANSIEKARKELDRDVIDIFGLHQQESEHTLRGHREALEYFFEAKQKGLIKAVLITTHCVKAVSAAVKIPEIDIIHPLININGLGIEDGSVEEMLEAIKFAHTSGKGIYSMKAFGGGNLLTQYKKCMDFVINNENIDSIAIGMKNIDELDLNIRYISGYKDVEERLSQLCKDKSIHIEFWCEKCGKCINKCSQNALIMKEKGIAVDRSKCLLCGYCGSVCPAFAIKIL